MFRTRTWWLFLARVTTYPSLVILRPQQRDTWNTQIYFGWNIDQNIHLHMRTFEFSQQSSIIGEDNNVELVSMRVTNQNISSIWRKNMLVLLYQVHLTSNLPEISIPLGKFVMFSHPILLTYCPSSVNTTTLWPWQSNKIN